MKDEVPLYRWEDGTTLGRLLTKEGVFQITAEDEFRAYKRMYLLGRVEHASDVVLIGRNAEKCVLFTAVFEPHRTELRRVDFFTKPASVETARKLLFWYLQDRGVSLEDREAFPVGVNASMDLHVPTTLPRHTFTALRRTKEYRRFHQPLVDAPTDTFRSLLDLVWRTASLRAQPFLTENNRSTSNQDKKGQHVTVYHSSLWFVLKKNGSGARRNVTLRKYGNDLQIEMHDPWIVVSDVDLFDVLEKAELIIGPELWSRWVERNTALPPVDEFLPFDTYRMLGEDPIQWPVDQLSDVWEASNPGV